MRLTLKDESQEDETPLAILEERVKFKDLTFGKKLTYIWDYYKWFIIIAVTVIIIIANAVPQIIENSKETVLYSVFINTQIESQESTSLMDDFTDSAGIDLTNKKIILDTSMKINRDVADTISMQSNQKLLALFSTNKLDVIVCDKDNFEFFASQGCFKTIEEVLPDDLYQKYKPYMLEASSGDSSKAVYGIDLKNSKILQKENAYIVDPILTFCVNSKNTEHAVAFLNYLLSDVSE